MGRPRKNPLPGIATPEQGAIATSPAPVREQIKQMTGYKTADEMAAALPTDTMTAPADEPRRKYQRKSKEPEAPQDPLLQDPRYKKAIANMQGFGGPALVKGGFSAVALATSDETIALKPDEGERVDDFFYVLGCRYRALDPSAHWFTMTLYFFGMLGSFIFSRVLSSKGSSMQKQIARWFKGEEETTDEKSE